MRTMELGKTGLQVPVIAVGCMRMCDKTEKEASEVVSTAMEQGMNFFDHADLYGGGKSEERFRQALAGAGVRREDILLQSKCGICPGKSMFDFSKEHILESVEGSLGRLGTDYLDVLLLHRPDTLFEPEEVAEAFRELKDSGKVRYFGVSNQNPMQMELMRKFWDEPLCADQLQLSITNCGMLKSGLNVNMENPSSVDHDGSVLEYCRLHDITIQAWSPFQYGFFEGCYVENPDFPEINAVLTRLAGQYGVSSQAIVLAWILRHPAHMQPLVGTMNPARLALCAKAAEVTLSRGEWYELYCAAGNILP